MILMFRARTFVAFVEGVYHWRCKPLVVHSRAAVRQAFVCAGALASNCSDQNCSPLVAKVDLSILLWRTDLFPSSVPARNISQLRLNNRSTYQPFIEQKYLSTFYRTARKQKIQVDDTSVLLLIKSVEFFLTCMKIGFSSGASIKRSIYTLGYCFSP